MSTLKVFVVSIFTLCFVYLVTPVATVTDVCASKTGDQARICAINDGVRQLLEKRNAKWGWGDRVNAEAIIALHLAKFTKFNPKRINVYRSVERMSTELLAAISRDRGLKSEDWSHGKLAHYILGLLATCQNPRDFYSHDLVNTLKTHLKESLNYFRSNKFAYSLVVLALCKAREPVDASYLAELSTTPGTYTFGVDEAALVYMAYHCVGDKTYSSKENAALQFILGKRDDKGLYGNEYSTALAVQAIFASGKKTLRPLTRAGITFMSQSIARSKKPFVSLLLSVLPAIAKKSYLTIGSKCAEFEIKPTPQPTIEINVFNNLTNLFDRTWNAPLHPGQTLYDALVNLQKEEPTFSFESKSTTWGQFITSVCHMVASTNEQQYWQLLDSNNVPLPKGASQTFPSVGDSFTMYFTTW